MQITIMGNPVTKKNHNQMVMVKGKLIVIPSKPYQEYEKKAKQYMPQLEKPIDYPINLKVNYYMQTRRKCDLTNLLQATCDILVKHKIIDDDNFTIVSSLNGCKVEYDKDLPRAEIYIEKLD